MARLNSAGGIPAACAAVLRYARLPTRGAIARGVDEVDEGSLAGDVQDAELLAHLVGPVVADLLVPAAALLRVEVFPSVERLDELVHPLLVERVRSSGVISAFL